MFCRLVSKAQGRASVFTIHASERPRVQLNGVRWWPGPGASVAEATARPQHASRVHQGLGGRSGVAPAVSAPGSLPMAGGSDSAQMVGGVQPRATRGVCLGGGVAVKTPSGAATASSPRVASAEAAQQVGAAPAIRAAQSGQAASMVVGQPRSGPGNQHGVPCGDEQSSAAAEARRH